MENLVRTALWRRLEGVVEAELAPGQAALLHLDTGQYHALNEVGTRIWGLLETARTLDDICGVLCSEYAIDAAQCAAEVGGYLGQLHTARLIEPTP